MIELLMPQVRGSSPTLDKSPTTASDVAAFKALLKDSALDQQAASQEKSPLLLAGTSLPALGNRVDSLPMADPLLRSTAPDPALADSESQTDSANKMPEDLMGSLNEVPKVSGALSDVPMPAQPDLAKVERLASASVDSKAQQQALVPITAFEPNAFTKSLLASIDMGHRGVSQVPDANQRPHNAPPTVAALPSTYGVSTQDTMFEDEPLAPKAPLTPLTPSAIPVEAKEVPKPSDSLSPALLKMIDEAGKNDTNLRTDMKSQPQAISTAPSIAATPIPLSVEPQMKNARMGKPGIVGPESITGAAQTDSNRPMNDPSLVAKTTSTPVLTPSSPQWSQDLSKQMIQMHLRGDKTMEIKLNPADLGPLTVNLKVNDAQALVHFTTVNPMVRQALEGAFGQLREMMSEQGLNLSGSTVGQGAGEGRDQGQQGNNQPDWLSTVDADDVSVAVKLPVGSSHEGMIDIYA